MIRVWLAMCSTVVLVACGAGDDDSQCMPAPGCYRATLGVGTGNCDAEMLLSSLGDLPTVSVSELDRCESIDLGDVPVSGACTGTAEASARLTDSGPQSGTLDVDASCPAAGGMCQHAFSLSFVPVDCP